jgi:hypothetical protein
MESCTVTGTRETTLLSGVVLLPSESALRPQPVPGCLVGLPSTTDAAGWRARPDTDVQGIPAPVAAFQGGAVTGLGFANVLDHMVTDHKYSTRLGSASCSPPV